MDTKSLTAAINQIASEKGISPDKVLAAVEVAIAVAYKREYRKKTEVIRAKFDLTTGGMNFFQVKTVVSPDEVRVVNDAEQGEYEEEKGTALAENSEDESLLPRYNSDKHIFLEEAKKIKPDTVPGEEMDFPLESHDDFGRIAAQTAKQVVLQSIREAERKSIQQEFVGKESEVVSGIIQRFERGNVYVDLGRAVGIMFPNESIPSEHYRVGQRMKFFVLAVQDDPRRPGIVLSRAHPKFIVKLFETEIPEMAEGVVEIKNVTREPGSRAKVAVASNNENVDPVGSAVGQRGMRVMAVTNELGNEKVDIVEWSEDPENFIASSLSPAKVKSVELLARREARVIVAEDQLSLAIGKGGQNVRLAAKLTGWKIDVRSQSNPDEVQEGGVATAPASTETVTPHEGSSETTENKNVKE